MGMSESSGSNSTTSTQPYIQSGPTIQASQYASQAQIAAAQMAAQAATQNTTSAINALMGEYSNAFQALQPSMQTGNQSLAQMNYMLGLPAINPGNAPTAPTAPIAADINNNPELANLFSLSNQIIKSGEVDKANAATNLNAPFNQANPSPINEIGSMLTQAAGTAHPGTWQQQLLQNAETSGISPSMSDAQIMNAIEAPGQQQYQQQLAQYNQQNQQWQNANNIYQQYSQKGTASPQDIANIVTNLPGFQFSQQQGINAIQNAASASGNLNSGNLLEQLNQFGQGLSQTYYQNYMKNLADTANIGQQSTNTAATGALNLGSNLASAYTNLGNTQANSALAAGNALASSYLLPVANQQVIMTPYTTTSNTSGSSSGFSGSAGGVLSGLSSIGSMFSNKALKEDFKQIDTNEILNRVNELNIEKWKYKGINQEHIGPYAEEFKQLFGVGDGLTINLIDLFGVLLSSVKELSLKLEKLESVQREIK